MLDELNTVTWLSRISSARMKFCIWPRRCYNTGGSIWLKYAYCTTKVITGPGDPIFVHRWYSREEFLLLRLKYGDFRSLA